MGLAVEVGFLVDLLQDDPEGADAFRDDLAAVNRILVASGLPEHREPDEADWDVLSYDMIGYSGLHYLRRIAAHLATRGTLPPPGDDNSSGDPVLREYYGESGGLIRRLFKARAATPAGARRFSHLMEHSDAEGYYVPIEFDAVLYAEPDLPLTGEMLGSRTAWRQSSRSSRRRSSCRRISTRSRRRSGTRPTTRASVTRRGSDTGSSRSPAHDCSPPRARRSTAARRSSSAKPYWGGFGEVSAVPSGMESPPLMATMSLLRRERLAARDEDPGHDRDTADDLEPGE